MASLFLLALLATASWANAQVILPPMVAKTSTLNLGIIGDWGRVGAVASIGIYDNWTAPIGGTPAGPGFCNASFNPGDDEDIVGGQDQVITADAMEMVCRKAKCAAIFNTGDNFYECGLDNPIRFKTDFTDIYQGENKSCIKHLPWFSSIGNHDIVATGSVDAQIDYMNKNPTWVLPSRYYGFNIMVPASHGKFIEIAVSVINTNPFITKYHKAAYKYNTVEMQALGTPQYISAQLDWLEHRLSHSTANMDIVIGHHPVVSASGTMYGLTALNLTLGAGEADDAGFPGADGMPSYTRLFSMLRKHNVAAYMNGHDHALAVGVDPENPMMYKTKYITSGAGSFPGVGDSCGVNRTYIKYVNGDYTGPDCNTVTGTAYPGFALLKIDGKKKEAKVEMYSVEDGVAPASASYTVDLHFSSKSARKVSRASKMAALVPCK